MILLQAEQDFLYGVTADGRVLIDGISDDTPEKAEFLQIVRSWQNVKYIEISSLFSLQAAALTYDGNLLYFRECIGGKYIDNYSDMWQRGAYTEVHFAGAGIAALEESGYVLMYSAVDKEVSRLDESLWYDIVHLSSRGGSTVIFGIRKNGELVYDYQKTVFSPAGKSWTRAEFAKYTPLKNVVAVTHTQSYAAVVTESGKVFLAGFLLTDDSPILSAHVLMNTRTDLVYTDFMEIALSAFNDPAAMADYVRSHMNAAPDNPMRQNEESYQKSSHCEKERLEQERMQKEQLEKERLEKEQLEKERLEKERLEKERLEKERLEKEQMQKERLEKEQLVIERRRLNVCQYCGGSFKGLFIKVCSRCGIKKDY